MAVMTMRSTFSFTRFSICAPASPPINAPTQAMPICSQCTRGEKMKTVTAAMFITPASTFLVAAAGRIASPAAVSAASIRKPMPPPK